MEQPDGVHHVLELVARMQNGGAEVEAAGLLAEPGAGHHAHSWEETKYYYH